MDPEPKFKKTGVVTFDKDGRVVKKPKADDGESSEEDTAAYDQQVKELNAIQKLLDMIETNKFMEDIKENAPGVVKVIQKYASAVERKMDVCEWVPDECQYSCRDMYIFWKVKK